jgi:integrase
VIGGIPRVRDRFFDTLEDAKAWLRRAATDEERGEFVDPSDGSITLADCIAMHWAPGRGGPMHAKSVRWPKAPQERRDAWPLERALRVRDVINPRNRITVVLGLGCGLRQGEVFGLSPEDIDYARGVLHVRRQVQAIKGRLYFTLPKGKKTRVVDMPSSVAEELKRHVEAFPPVKVELPWGKPEAEGQRRKFSLLLTTRFGNAIAVNTWNTYTWKPALAASIMLEAGESVVTVARWLGHSSPAITLGYYAHFMPEAGSKGRTAIDRLLERQGDLHASRNSPDSPQG